MVKSEVKIGGFCGIGGRKDHFLVSEFGRLRRIAKFNLKDFLIQRIEIKNVSIPFLTFAFFYKDSSI